MRAVCVPGPAVQAAPLTELLPETRERFGPIAESPYTHQGAAVRRIMAGLPTVVATGTGSGKTEAFLMPIVDHCLRVGQAEFAQSHSGVPDECAGDQRDRIRELLAGTKVGFGVYTGETMGPEAGGG